MAANKIDLNPKPKLLKGIDILYRAVSTTLGPRGRNVGIDWGYQKSIIHDGVSVAKTIMLPDLVENFGAGVVMEAAKKQVKEVGDATTATIVLAHSIIMEAEKLIQAGVNPMSLRAGLEAGVARLVNQIKDRAIEIKTEEEQIQVATISAEDEELGKLVADVVNKVGPQGLITVEESKSAETSYEHQEGMQFDSGYSTQYFITNVETLEATLNDTHVLVTDMKLNPNDLMPLFKEVFETRTEPLVIIGPEPLDSLRDFLVVNKMSGKIRALYIKAPVGNDRANSFLQDIAILTGGRFISSQKGDLARDVKFADLGHASRITSFASSTEIVGGRGKKEDIEARATSLKKLIEEEESDFERDKLKERFAKLTGGVGVIKVGGQTEIEMKERKERVDDAVHALRAAINEGIIPGGEIIYLSIKNTLKEDTYANTILKNALVKPFEKLMSNAGLEPGQMLERLMSEDQNTGIDVTDGQIKNMKEAGIIDPAQVAICALQNAVSVAVQIITTDCVIVPIPDKK